VPADDSSPSGQPAPDDGRRALGTLGEDLAVEHYRRLGFVLVARNVRTRRGEIDLIVFDGAVLAFVEVKTKRARGARGGACPHEQPLSWLSAAQRGRLRRLACAWLYEEHGARPRAQTIRFDAVGVILDGSGRLLRLDQIENAW
jgi:putative endonuclease